MNKTAIKKALDFDLPGVDGKSHIGPTNEVSARLSDPIKSAKWRARSVREKQIRAGA